MTVVNVDTPILNLEGDALENATAKSVILEALMVTFEDDRNLTGEQKIKIFLLAQRVQSGGEVDFTSDDITLMKTRVAKGFNALAVGRVWELLDPASVK